MVRRSQSNRPSCRRTVTSHGPVQPQAPLEPEARVEVGLCRRYRPRDTIGHGCQHARYRKMPTVRRLLQDVSDIRISRRCPARAPHRELRARTEALAKNGGAQPSALSSTVFGDLPLFERRKPMRYLRHAPRSLPPIRGGRRAMPPGTRTDRRPRVAARLCLRR